MSGMLKRIGIPILIGFVALVSQSCDKSNGAASTVEQKTLIDFAASSHEVATKGTSLSKHHPDFGVWGIARKSGQMDYVLWENSAMTKAVQKGTSNVYTPIEDAFWLSGYTYNFLAVAPWESAAGITAITSGTTNGAESLSFSYSLADKYGAATPDYDFDLMAAVAQTTTGVNHTAAQPLTFWHLFAQICIKVEFVKADGTPAAGSVSEIRLFDVDQVAAYTISSKQDHTINVACQSGERQSAVNPIVFGASEQSTWTLNIVPQNRKAFKCFIDFTLGEGDAAVAYRDFELNLESAANPENYGYNDKVNWVIKIGPKATISFKVEVAQWIDSVIPDGEDDTDKENGGAEKDNDDVEII